MSEHTLELVLHPSPNKLRGLHAVSMAYWEFSLGPVIVDICRTIAQEFFEVILFAQRWWTPCVA